MNRAQRIGFAVGYYGTLIVLIALAFGALALCTMTLQGCDHAETGLTLAPPPPPPPPTKEPCLEGFRVVEIARADWPVRCGEGKRMAVFPISETHLLLECFCPERHPQ